MPTGRPTSYRQDVADSLLDRLAEGELITAICAEEGMPSRSTLFRWCEADPAFRGAFQRARQAQAQAVAERAVINATKATDATLGRLAFDAQRRLASKLDPARYGDRLQQQHTGPNGGPLTVTIAVDRPPTETREDWLARRRGDLGDGISALLG